MRAMATRRVRFVVTGIVQGVAYRAAARRAAGALSGWIRNREDGAVEGEAQGPAEALERFIAWCGHGPPGARVDAVAIEARATIDDDAAFEIRR